MPRPAARRLRRTHAADALRRGARGAEWIHEIKFDGYRTMLTIRGKDVHAYARALAITGLYFSVQPTPFRVC